ncbi:hypothetical protein EDD15DRAFT_2360361 [Pisolithus albus]|nr:hypothetical protein EDD15DRAFT_2360361 [Pisolithus albus]
MPRAPPSDPAAHAACSFENQSVVAREYEQGNTLRTPTHGPKVAGIPVKLPLAYPHFSLYPPKYPYNVYCIYPDIEPSPKQFSISVNLPSRYPWLYIYTWEYPHIAPYPVASASVVSPRVCQGKPTLGWVPINARLSPTYPTLDIYPPSYPWNLRSIYPPTGADYCALFFSFRSSRINLTAWVVQDAEPASLCSVEREATRPVLMETTQRKRKTHAELHAAVSRSLEKKKLPKQNSKSHRELHEEVFKDRVAWSPSGSVDIPFSSFPKKRTERPAQSPTRTSPADLLKGMASGYARSRPAKATPSQRSWGHIMTTAPTSPVVPPIYLPRVLSSGPPAPPVLVVSESPSPRSLLHTPTPKSRWSEAMKSIVPGLQRSKSSKALGYF